MRSLTFNRTVTFEVSYIALSLTLLLVPSLTLGLGAECKCSRRLYGANCYGLSGNGLDLR